MQHESSGTSGPRNGLSRESGRIVRDLVINGVLASPVVLPQLRWRLLRAVGLDVSKSHIASHTFFGSSEMSIGLETFVNRECLFDGSARITIGSRVRIGMRCTFVTGSHEIGTHEQRAGRATSAPIVVEDGVWVGAGATILPGVTIGAGAIVAAGAVVTRSVEPGTTVAGVPARAVQPRSSN